MSTGHNKLSRAEAAANRWVPVRPTDDQLADADAPVYHDQGVHVAGPHLRRTCKTSRSNIGVPGICRGTLKRYGREETVFYVQLGAHSYRVYTQRLGIPEAFRRALEIRRRWEGKVAAANEAILKARGQSPRDPSK